MGCEVRFDPKLKEEALAAAVEAVPPGRPGGAFHQSARSGARRRRAEAGGARRRGLQHHRCGGGIAARDLCLQLPRQELDCRGRAGVRSDSGAGPADRRQRHRAAAGRVEQERLLQSARPLRADAGADRPGTDRPRSCPARRSLRPAGRGVEPQPHRRCRAPARRATHGLAHRGGARRRYRQRARRAQRADQGTDRRGFLCRHAAGRVFHQHGARRSGGSGGAGTRGARRKAFAPGWTSSPRNRRAARASSPTAS